MPAEKKPSRESRAAARRSWPVRSYRLGAEPSDDLSKVTTAEERLEMMWPLARDAWSVAGQRVPEYARSETPVRVVVRSVSTKAQSIR